MTNLRKIIVAMLGPALTVGGASFPREGIPDGRWWFLVVMAGLGGLVALGTNAGAKAAKVAKEQRDMEGE